MPKFPGHKQSRGFTTVEVAIVAVVVLALALGGWYVWRQNQDDAGNKTSQSGSSPSTNKEQNVDGESAEKTYNCKDLFTVIHPDSLQATLTDAQQCLISNVSIDAMPPVGPLPPDQLGLFFSTQATETTASKEYLAEYVARSQEDSPLELKSQQEVRLNSGATATLATLYGGHPVQHDFYFFIYIKDGIAITTSYPKDSNHKDTALKVLKSIK